MSTDRPQLEYAPGAPVRRRRRIWRAVTMLLILAVGWLGWRHGPGYVLRARQMYWQGQCMRFTTPPETVMYERLPAGSPRPVVDGPLIDMDSPEAATLPRVKVASMMLPSNQPPPVVVNKGPRCLLSLERVAPALALDGGAVLFCHERTSPAGSRRLVTVQLPAPYSDYFLGDLLVEHMAPYASPRLTMFGPPPSVEGGMQAMAHSGPALPPPTRIFAGQPDPADPSHFTIEYEWPDGVRGIVDGWLRDDDSVDLKMRPGEGDIRSAFERGLHQRW